MRQWHRGFVIIVVSIVALYPIIAKSLLPAWRDVAAHFYWYVLDALPYARCVNGKRWRNKNIPLEMSSGRISVPLRVLTLKCLHFSRNQMFPREAKAAWNKMNLAAAVKSAQPMSTIMKESINKLSKIIVIALSSFYIKGAPSILETLMSRMIYVNILLLHVVCLRAIQVNRKISNNIST